MCPSVMSSKTESGSPGNQITSVAPSAWRSSRSAAALVIPGFRLGFNTTDSVVMTVPAPSGWLLALTLSFDDVVTSSFLAGPENTTLPMAIFSGLRVGLDPQINAIGTLMVVGIAAIVGVSFTATRIGGLMNSRRKALPNGKV
jgi:hypothetical protein